jgi:hypothetical protein
MNIALFESEKRSDNFCEIFRLDVSSIEDFTTPPVRSLYKWWQSSLPDLPSYSDFKIENHWSIAANLYVIQFLSPGRYFYRLNGEKVVDITGTSLRGHEISKNDSLLENRYLATYLDKIVENATCKRCSGKLENFGSPLLNFESVDCPLLNSEGQIEYIIGAIALLD